MILKLSLGASTLHRNSCGSLGSPSGHSVDSAIDAVTTGAESRQELAVHFGEDFELVFTVPEDAVAAAREESPVEVTPIGRVTDDGVRMDGDPLPDRGFTH